MKGYLFLLLLPLIFFACDNEHLHHELLVINGDGSGDYALGEQVAITANPAPEGQAFFEWNGDVQFIDEAKAPFTALTMPLQDVVIEATFKDLPRYDLTIINGSGTGQYIAGTIINITAIPPEDKLQFVKWIGDTTFLNKTDTVIATVIMPEKPITLEATFEEIISEVSFSQDVFPIIETKCAKSGCHDAFSEEVHLTNYEEIEFNSRRIVKWIERGDMPPEPDPPLSEEEINLIVSWVDQGAKNN